jgi:cell fate regulator YaaT (PSP1 superfamily)
MDEQSVDRPSRQRLVVAIRFKPGGLTYEFDPAGMQLHPDDRVVVETERGSMLGIVATPPYPRDGRRPLDRVVKKADARDLMRHDRDLQRVGELTRAVLAALGARTAACKLVKVEGTADGSRTTVYLAAEERLEVRDLVRTLTQALRTQVEIKQIGARDAAREAGGLGVCGRELCCSSWLKQFQPVSVKMVKAQGLALNPSKLAGQCGRLKCCLRYEYQTYLELKRNLPNVGTTVESVKGNGQVIGQNLLGQTVFVRRDDDGERVEVTLEDLVQRRPDA